MILFYNSRYQNEAICFKSSQGHPTFDCLSVHFDKQLKVKSVKFYNVTSGVKHDFNINARFINYLNLLKGADFEFCYVVAQSNYSTFTHFQYPKDKSQLKQKLENLKIDGKQEWEIEEEKQAFIDWENIYKSQFKFAYIQVSNDQIKSDTF
jgi:hypothetical protein